MGLCREDERVGAKGNDSGSVHEQVDRRHKWVEENLNYCKKTNRMNSAKMQLEQSGVLTKTRSAKNKNSVVSFAGCGVGSDYGFGNKEKEVEEAEIGLDIGAGEIERATLKFCGVHYRFGTEKYG